MADEKREQPAPKQPSKEALPKTMANDERDRQLAEQKERQKNA